MPRTRCCLWFDTQAEEAVSFYVSVFPGSRINAVTRYGPGLHRPEGMVLTIDFELDGLPYLAVNGGPEFNFTPAVSLVIDCESQDEIDYFWQQLSASPGHEQCGWLQDRFGLSWQVVPTQLPEMLQDPDTARRDRVMHALLTMKKLDIAQLQQAFDIL